jgi:hypothetical protein
MKNLKGDLVSYRVFDGTDNTADVYVKEWREDKTVSVRSYRRAVRADGVPVYVTVIIVRRKLKKVKQQ